jgi:CheY-like chemotaxis protein
MTSVTGPEKDAWVRHLRAADELSKKKKFEEAILELEQALKIDPKDLYARSFLERLRAQWSKKQDDEKSATEKEQVTLEERMEMIPKLLAKADQLIADHDYEAALKQIAKVYSIDPNNYYAQAHSDRIEQLMMDEEAKRSGATEEKPGQESKAEDSGDSIFYRELLREYWYDGKLTEEEVNHLRSVQPMFGISPEDHERLSKEIKFEAYVEALHIAWIDGVITENERRTLEFMRNKYGITPDENARAETAVQKLREDVRERSKVILVDSDKDHAHTITKVLKKHGYSTLLTARPEDALKVLSHTKPKCLIMCLKFEGSEIDGVELYRRALQLPHIRRIPMFLIVDLDDKDVLHAAMRLGIDHVITKPVDPEFIVAALRGRKNREEQAF